MAVPASRRAYRIQNAQSDRPLRRAIQSALQNKVADKLLEEDFDAEHIIVVDAEGEKICLTVSGEESPVQEKQEEQLEKA